MRPLLVAAALLFPPIVFAQSSVLQDSTEFAKVLNYAPLPGPQVARQVCAPVAAAPAPAHNPGGAIAGGVVGALVGSRFGGGHGRDAATVAGAIGGAMVGDQIGSGQTTQQQCNTVYEAGPPAGYQVNYSYRGKRYTTTTNYPPGEFLKVRTLVTVE